MTARLLRQPPLVPARACLSLRPRALPRILTGMDSKANALWLMGGKTLGIAAGVAVSAVLARCWGPDTYGLFNYVMAFTGLFGIWTSLGLKSVITRDLVRDPGSEGRIMGSALGLQLGAALAAFIASTISLMLSRKGDTEAWILGLACSAVFFADAMMGMEAAAEAKSRFRLIAAAQAIPLLVFSALKIAGAAAGAPPWTIALLVLLQSASSCLILYMYGRKNTAPAKWRFDPAEARRLFAEGLPILLSGVVVTVYMRSDQVMIGLMRSDAEVGLYSVAVKISEAWYLVPAALAASVYPSLIKAHSGDKAAYSARLQDFLDMMFAVGLAGAFATSFLARPLVSVIYGPGYAQAADILVIHAWGGVFASMGIACKHWFVLEGKQRHTLYRTLAGCVMNIILNAVLIPGTGGTGAALATVASQAMALFLFNGLNPNSRELFRMQLRSLWPYPRMAAVAARRRVARAGR